MIRIQPFRPQRGVRAADTISPKRFRTPPKKPGRKPRDDIKARP